MMMSLGSYKNIFIRSVWTDWSVYISSICCFPRDHISNFNYHTRYKLGKSALDPRMAKLQVQSRLFQEFWTLFIVPPLQLKCCIWKLYSLSFWKVLFRWFYSSVVSLFTACFLRLSIYIPDNFIHWYCGQTTCVLVCGCISVSALFVSFDRIISDPWDLGEQEGRLHPDLDLEMVRGTKNWEIIW